MKENTTHVISCEAKELARTGVTFLNMKKDLGKKKKQRNFTFVLVIRPLPRQQMMQNAQNGLWQIELLVGKR